MTVYLFRHGDVIIPDDVLYGRFPGFHLSEQGKQDVAIRASMLKGAHIRHIISSPLERTAETSDSIAQTLALPKSSISYDDRLIEVDCRDWTGKPMDQFLQDSDYLSNPQTQIATEPLLDAGKRIFAVLDELKHTKENNILVSHGDPIMGLVSLLLNDRKFYYYHNHYIAKATYLSLQFDGESWHIHTPPYK
ncbi:histidine phosphatase family protein [Candidatus Saccharibacteria bacterium]|nr:histidine phosphatase family protein [Candidatus Saccharibacteria bacterium]